MIMESLLCFYSGSRYEVWGNRHGSQPVPANYYPGSIPPKCPHRYEDLGGTRGHYKRGQSVGLLSHIPPCTILSGPDRPNKSTEVRSGHVIRFNWTTIIQLTQLLTSPISWTSLLVTEGSIIIVSSKTSLRSKFLSPAVPHSCQYTKGGFGNFY